MTTTLTPVQKKLHRLKGEKTVHPTEELDRLGWARYEEVQENLEDCHRGDYMMVEVDSGDFFIGKTPDEALRQAEAVHPGKPFCLIRIGYKAVHKLKRVQ
jgi:hypothetical protein